MYLRDSMLELQIFLLVFLLTSVQIWTEKGKMFPVAIMGFVKYDYVLIFGLIIGLELLR